MARNVNEISSAYPKLTTGKVYGNVGIPSDSRREYGESPNTAIKRIDEKIKELSLPQGKKETKLIGSRLELLNALKIARESAENAISYPTYDAPHIIPKVHKNSPLAGEF